jgi:hypothetical protein
MPALFGCFVLNPTILTLSLPLPGGRRAGEGQIVLVLCVALVAENALIGAKHGRWTTIICSLCLG